MNILELNMSDQDEPTPESETHDAAKSQDQSPTTDESSAAEHAPETEQLDLNKLPPADFNMLVTMFTTQALVALGMVPSPDGQTMKQLPLAKHFIDLLSILQTKCKGNLTGHESNLLENSLHELRMAYVAASKESNE